MHTHRSCDVILILFFFMIKHLVPLKILKCNLMSAYTIEHLNPFWSRIRHILLLIVSNIKGFACRHPRSATATRTDSPLGLAVNRISFGSVIPIKNWLPNVSLSSYAVNSVLWMNDTTFDCVRGSTNSLTKRNKWILSYFNVCSDSTDVIKQ